MASNQRRSQPIMAGRWGPALTALGIAVALALASLGGIAAGRALEPQPPGGWVVEPTPQTPAD